MSAAVVAKLWPLTGLTSIFEARAAFGPPNGTAGGRRELIVPAAALDVPRLPPRDDDALTISTAEPASRSADEP